MTKIDGIVRILKSIEQASWVVICLLGLIAGILLGGCSVQSPKECCSDRGGVQMCYHPNPKIEGYIMCKDGYICNNSRCE